MGRALFRAAWLLILATQTSWAGLSDVTQQTMNEVLRIAKAIAAVQPNLDDTKLMEYGLGIYRASKRYDIEPEVLIAITQQETGFREHLPEGRAGEIGICQIRKQWLQNPQFRTEFRSPKISDLKRPSKSFLMAAWILRDLKNRKSSHRTIPYWSYYNAVRFENRFKYYLLVNRNIATLRRHEAVHGKISPAPEIIGQRDNETEAPTQEASFLPVRTQWISDAVEKLDELRRNRNRGLGVEAANDGRVRQD